ncbi:MAG TPA: DUF6491 family protein [Caulobacteraceae bacterium]
MNAFRLLTPMALGAVLASADPCFLQRNINGFSAPNDRTVYVRVGVKDIWRLGTMNTCTGLTFRNAFALEGSPTSAWICKPLDATIRFNETGMRMICPVSSIHKLTPAEVAALPKRDRP